MKSISWATALILYCFVIIFISRSRKEKDVQINIESVHVKDEIKPEQSDTIVILGPDSVKKYKYYKFTIIGTNNK
jgi:hypothetical protein